MSARAGAAMGASIGGLIAYTLAALRPGPVTPLYFPRLGAWSLHARPGEPAIAWFGLLLDLALGAALGALLGAGWRRRPAWSAVWVLGAIAILVLAWHERHWLAR